nr:RNA-directed DNA polymerase, eukaryota [Tanacetum cinerariifolium]
QNVRQDGGAIEAIQELRDSIDDIRGEKTETLSSIKADPTSRDTFLKIGKNWKESMDSEENIVSSFARKHLCIKTNRSDNILEKFKITHRGKVHLARAKELFAWTPIFLDCKVSEYISDDDVLHSACNNYVGPQQGGDDLVVDSDMEGVSDTIFDDNLASPVNSVDDPIGECIDTGFVKESSPSVHLKVMNNSEEVHVKEVSKGNSEFRYSYNHKGGSIMEVLDDMVRVGQSMRYDMDGLGHKMKKEWVQELNLQHKVNFLTLQETKMDRITHMDVKLIWSNSNYQFVSSDSVGNSGGILCIWEATVFKKAYVTVSDNFIAIYETWISNNFKVLIVVVYAPQSLALKRALWEYISSLISHWDEVFTDFGPTPFHLYHSWFKRDGFDAMVEHAWNSFSHLDSNKLIRLKKLQDLKVIIRRWIKDKNLFHIGDAKSIKENLTDIDKNLDRGNVFDELLLKRMDFMRGNFLMGSNASFIALIPEVTDAKFVTDFKPISLIGCVYKVVTKILSNRLAMVITDLKKKQAMIFKVDFAKAYDSVRWDYLLDVLHAFGFSPNWCKWIRGTFSSSMASVLVNGNPSLEFPFFCGLKQGDPLAPYLFILIIESLHISFSRSTSAGVFNGIRINDSTVISHLFYADDAIFMGEWSNSNMANIVKILRCLFLTSGLKINIQKSQILGVGVHQNHVSQAALLIGCTVMQTPFRYLG